jgi:transcription antitermination factor NusG
MAEGPLKDNSSDKNWYVIYTKPKSEKVVEQRLREKGITTYLPLRTTLKQWSDRKKKIQVPLFNSYVFIHSTEKERNKVFEVSGVLNFLFWLGKPAIVRPIEIERIKNFLAGVKDSEVVVENLQPGDLAKIKSGDFKDVEVEIESVDKKVYYVVLESLGVRLKVDKHDVEKVNKNK